MKRKLFRNVLPLLCAALIVAAGLLAPQWLLEQQKSRILTGTGSVETNSLAALNYDELRSAATRQHISDLSDWAEELAENGADTDAQREPLDTELNEFQAAQAAASFQTALLRALGEQGFNVAWATVEYYGTGSTAESAAEIAESGAELEAETVDEANTAEDYGEVSYGVDGDFFFRVSEEDSSLSAWVLENEDGAVQLVLDAVSGIPVYGFAEVSLADAAIGSISQSAANSVGDAYQELYSLSFSEPSLVSSSDYGSHIMDSYGNLRESDEREVVLEEWELTTEDGYVLRAAARSTYTRSPYGSDYDSEEHRVELWLDAE